MGDVANLRFEKTEEFLSKNSEKLRAVQSVKQDPYGAGLASTKIASSTEIPNHKEVKKLGVSIKQETYEDITSRSTTPENLSHNLVNEGHIKPYGKEISEKEKIKIASEFNMTPEEFEAHENQLYNQAVDDISNGMSRVEAKKLQVMRAMRSKNPDIKETVLSEMELEAEEQGYQLKTPEELEADQAEMEAELLDLEESMEQELPNIEEEAEKLAQEVRVEKVQVNNLQDLAGHTMENATAVGDVAKIQNATTTTIDQTIQEVSERSGKADGKAPETSLSQQGSVKDKDIASAYNQDLEQMGEVVGTKQVGEGDPTRRNAEKAWESAERGDMNRAEALVNQNIQQESLEEQGLDVDIQTLEENGLEEAISENLEEEQVEPEITEQDAMQEMYASLYQDLEQTREQLKEHNIENSPSLEQKEHDIEESLELSR